MQLFSFRDLFACVLWPPLIHVWICAWLVWLLSAVAWCREVSLPEVFPVLQPLCETMRGPLAGIAFRRLARLVHRVVQHLHMGRQYQLWF